MLPVDFRTAAALDNDMFAKSKSTKPTLACLTIRRGAVFSQTSCTINPCFTDQHRAELRNMMHPCFTDQPTFKLQIPPTPPAVAASCSNVIKLGDALQWCQHFCSRSVPHCHNGSEIWEVQWKMKWIRGGYWSRGLVSIPNFIFCQVMEA